MSSAFTPSYDLLALGEVLLRLDPGNARVRTARQFTAWEGGGEYNVARGLRSCFGMQTAVLTGMADNEIGRLVENLILQSGVDGRLIKWMPYDGIGRRVRNAINFTERGFGIRGAKGCVDRGHGAASLLKPGDFDWDALLGDGKCRWLHTGGIFAGLSETTAELTIQACEAAKRHGVTVSYDLNYRPSLWQERGGFPSAQALNHRLAPYVNVMIGVLTDDEPAGFVKSEDPSDPFSAQAAALQKSMTKMLERYPNIHTCAATLRRVHTASKNDFGALAWMDGQFYRARNYVDLDIFDRIGGGDSFVAGLVYGLLNDLPKQYCLDLGVAHGALAMSTPGDTSMATLIEVEKLAKGGDAKVQR